ncbi:MAG: hypothetical protein ACRDKL_09680 [Solirubrobacteraceae bacterium]
MAIFAEAPALPLHAAGKFVAGAYVVFVAILLFYVWIMARRLHSTQRELLQLKALVDQRDSAATGPAGPVADPPAAETEPDAEPERVP